MGGIPVWLLRGTSSQNRKTYIQILSMSHYRCKLEYTCRYLLLSLFFSLVLDIIVIGAQFNLSHLSSIFMFISLPAHLHRQRVQTRGTIIGKVLLGRKGVSLCLPCLISMAKQVQQISYGHKGKNFLELKKVFLSQMAKSRRVVYQGQKIVLSHIVHGKKQK